MTDTTNQARPATCGDGCSCLTDCGDTYQAAGLPKPPRLRPTLTLRTLNAAALEARDATLHECEARTLVDYVQDLERRQNMLEVRVREGTAGLRPQVIAFAWLMEHKLRKHDAERGARGWIGTHPSALFDRMDVAGNELARALGAWHASEGEEGPRAARVLAAACADVANFAMMTADTVGALDGVGAGPVAKLRKGVRQLHRLQAHITRLLERRRVEIPQPPAYKLNALEDDVRAIAWALHVLDPQGIGAPEPRAIAGDGTGQALPPAPLQPIEQVALA